MQLKRINTAFYFTDLLCEVKAFSAANIYAHTLYIMKNSQKQQVSCKNSVFAMFPTFFPHFGVIEFQIRLAKPEKISVTESTDCSSFIPQVRIIETLYFEKDLHQE